VAAVLAAYDAGLVLLSAQDRAKEAPFRVGAALRTVSDTLLGLPAGLHAWEALAVLAIAAAGALAVLVRWLAPWQADEPHGPEGRGRALAIVREWGSDTLAPFVLRADKAYFFSPSGRSLVAYRVVAGVAVVSGDPLGPPDERDEVLEGFVRYARARAWRVAVLGASERCLEEYRRRGFRCLYHGDEPVLDLEQFSLEGRAIRKVRQSVARLERAGYTAELLGAQYIAPDVRRELEAVEAAWRGDAPVRGFAMAMDDLFRLERDDAVLLSAGRPTARSAASSTLPSHPRAPLSRSRPCPAVATRPTASTSGSSARRSIGPVHTTFGGCR
jgi:lysyl-tRNA synthetase, class II